MFNVPLVLKIATMAWGGATVAGDVGATCLPISVNITKTTGKNGASYIRKYDMTIYFANHITYLTFGPLEA